MLAAARMGLPRAHCDAGNDWNHFMSVIHRFDLAVQARPDHPCLLWDQGQLTYREAHSLSHRIACGLRESGFMPGTKGAVLSANDAYAFVCVLGLMRAGLVWLPLNPRNPLAENARSLADFDCEVLFFHSEFEADVPRLQQSARNIRLVVPIDRSAAGEAVLSIWAARQSDHFEPLILSPEHPAAISATGGTTGQSKGVVHTIGSFEAFTTAHRELHRRDADPVFLAAAPMTHAGGRMCLSVVGQGGTLVVLARPEPQTVLQAIERYHVTRLYLPPTSIYALLARDDRRQYDYRSLKYFIYGGAPMSLEKLRQAIDVFGPVMSAGYGQTEAPLAIAHFPPEDHFVNSRLGGEIASDARLASCGRPTRFVEVSIMDDGGQFVSTGTAGEIVIRGSIVMQGYYRNEEATAESRRGPWHLTGDVGYFDEEGFLYLVDRKRDLIISGGFNVYPSEVEQVILSLPGVQDCAVVGVPDEKWGEAVKAVVQLLPRSTLTADEIIAACRPRLGGVKTPKSVELWPDLPRSTVGKVLRRAVRDRYWMNRARAI